MRQSELMTSAALCAAGTRENGNPYVCTPVREAIPPVRPRASRTFFRARVALSVRRKTRGCPPGAHLSFFILTNGVRFLADFSEIRRKIPIFVARLDAGRGDGGFQGSDPPGRVGSERRGESKMQM